MSGMGSRVAGLIVALALVSSPVTAQTAIPNGVFVKGSDGTMWLVLNGEKVPVPIWQATDEEIAALPTSERWAVMNAAGTIGAGERPAWLPPAPIAVLAPVPPTASALSQPPNAQPPAPLTNAGAARCTQTALDVTAIASGSPAAIENLCATFVEIFGQQNLDCFEREFRATAREDSSADWVDRAGTQAVLCAQQRQAGQ